MSLQIRALDWTTHGADQARWKTCERLADATVPIVRGLKSLARSWLFCCDILWLRWRWRLIIATLANKVVNVTHSVFVHRCVDCINQHNKDDTCMMLSHVGLLVDTWWRWFSYGPMWVSKSPIHHPVDCPHRSLSALLMPVPFCGPNGRPWQWPGDHASYRHGGGGGYCTMWLQEIKPMQSIDVSRFHDYFGSVLDFGK